MNKITQGNAVVFCRERCNLEGAVTEGLWPLRSYQTNVQGHWEERSEQALQESHRSGIQSFQDCSFAETRLSRHQRAGTVLRPDGPYSLRVRPARFCGSRRAGPRGSRGEGRWAGPASPAGAGLPAAPPLGGVTRGPRPGAQLGAAGRAPCAGRGRARGGGAGPGAVPRSGGRRGAGRGLRGPRGWRRGRRARAGPSAPLGPPAWRRGRALAPLDSPCPALGLPPGVWRPSWGRTPSPVRR